jgi:hypothetical protein
MIVRVKSIYKLIFEIVKFSVLFYYLDELRLQRVNLDLGSTW